MLRSSCHLCNLISVESVKDKNCHSLTNCSGRDSSMITVFLMKLRSLDLEPFASAENLNRILREICQSRDESFELNGFYEKNFSFIIFLVDFEALFSKISNSMTATCLYPKKKRKSVCLGAVFQRVKLGTVFRQKQNLSNVIFLFLFLLFVLYRVSIESR